MQQKCIISQYEGDTSIKINDTPLSYWFHPQGFIPLCTGFRHETFSQKTLKSRKWPTIEQITI